MTPHRFLRLLAVVVLAALAVSIGDFRSREQDKKEDKPEPAPKFTATQISFYEKEVLPVLKQNCFRCHGDETEKIKGGLNLTTRKAVLDGGETGPVVNLAKPADSLLVKAIHYKDENHKMPPKGKMPDKDIATLEKWVTDGLPVSTDRLGGDIAKAPPKGVITEEAKRYWVYQPVKRSPVPEVKDKTWVKTPIDAFILAKLEAKGLKPIKPAEKAALVRRAYYDLLGLPPTPEEVDAFVNSKDADAWEKLIDKLLASPHYGEKWGRHWLDVVRFAE